MSDRHRTVSSTDITHLEALRQAVERSDECVPPPAVGIKARLLLLDTIGCVLSGRSAAPVARFERELSALDPGPFRFPGGPGLSVQGAAALGAMASAWDEGCEGLPYAHGRPALALTGALLPCALVRGLSTRSLVSAFIAGYECGARAGGWLRIRKGLHVDGNWPALGVASGISQLLGLDAAARWNAVATVACQLPASLYLPIRTGDTARNTYPAHAAMLGLQAAMSSAAGLSAPEQALTEYATEHAQPDGNPAPAAERWFVLEAYFKLHAGVRHAHYGFESAARIRERLRGRCEGVTAARLRIYPEAIVYAGNRAPRAAITGQFSLSLGVAAGLRFGAMEPELFRGDRLTDPELRRLEQQVELEADPALGRNGRRAAMLSVEADGQTLEDACEHLDGDPSRPVDTARIVDKFVRYSACCLEESRARAFAEALLDDTREAQFGDLWRLLLD